MIGFAYVAVNFGSQSKMSLREIAVPLVLVFMAVYFLYPLFASFVTWLMHVGSFL
jgi:uncharacterized membrane protein (DUF485 family)